MQVVNSDVEQGEQPVVQSRYSIVMAAAKRARQIITASNVTNTPITKKPLSIAVDELHNGSTKILGEEDNEEMMAEAGASEEFFAEATEEATEVTAETVEE